MELGRIVSIGSTPSTEKFFFVVRDNVDVKKGMYVSVRTEQGELIARINDIIRYNPYFERPDTVREIERMGKSVEDLFPTERWEYLLAECATVGVFTDSGFQRAFIPPKPGSLVETAREEVLSELFGFVKNGLYLGKLLYHDVDARISMTRLLQKHLAILAMSGAGKSYLASVIIEELLDRDESEGKIAVVLIDTHGEYLGFAEDANYMNKTIVVNAEELKIGVPKLQAEFFEEVVPQLSGPQRRELKRIVDDLKREKENTPYSIDDLIKKVESDRFIRNQNTREVILTHLYRLKSYGIFGYYSQPSIKDMCQPGKLCIVDMSQLESQEARHIVVHYIAREIFTARKKGEIPPTLLIIEEAHNYAPEGVKRESAIARGIIEKIAREGRKFHVCLCLISQRPINLSTTALSQCNTHIILRVNNPNDLDHIGKTSEGITKEVLRAITSLQVGEALIVGEAVNFPVFIKVRKRRSYVKKGETLEEAAKRYLREMIERENDVRAFI